MSTSQVSTIPTADGYIISDADRQMVRWDEYFEQIFMVDPPSGQFQTAGVQTTDTNTPIAETPFYIDEVKEAVEKLRGGKATCVCNIRVEMLKAESMIRGLYTVLTAVWQSGTIPPDWKRRLIVPIWRGKGNLKDYNNYCGITLLIVSGKVLDHLLLMWIRSYLLKHQRPEQSGFMPGK